jgi:hypothetical protein
MENICQQKCLKECKYTIKWQNHWPKKNNIKAIDQITKEHDKNLVQRIFKEGEKVLLKVKEFKLKIGKSVKNERAHLKSPKLP